jgi:hypothetical protein
LDVYATDKLSAVGILMDFRTGRRLSLRFVAGHLTFELLQLLHYLLGFGPFRFQTLPFFGHFRSLPFLHGIHFGKLLLFVPLEKSDTIDTLDDDQQQKWEKDADYISGCGF